MVFLSFRKFLIIFWITTLGSVLLPSIPSAQLQIKTLLSKLDNNYYYPQKKGLTSISARLEWKQKDISSGKKLFIKKPDFRFVGELDKRIFRKRFIVNTIKINLSNDERIQHIKVLNNYLDAFLPKTLHEKFSDYRGKINFHNEKEIILQLKSSDPLDNIKDYELFIDAQKWRIARIQIRQNQEPRSVEGNFFYTRKDGQWVVAETLSKFTINNQAYSEKTEYRYKNLKSFWLVNKISQTVKQEGQVILSYRFQLNDYKLNSRN